MPAAYPHQALLQASELKIPANLSPKISFFVPYSGGVGALAVESDITGLHPGSITYQRGDPGTVIHLLCESVFSPVNNSHHISLVVESKMNEFL